MAKTYKVVASALNVRKGPGVGYAKVDMLYNGDTVEVDREEDGWAHIGDYRWCSMDYLVEVASSSSNSVAPSYIPSKDLDNRPIYLMQSDPRWRSKPYTSSNNPTQTIGSSGCGPTAASMIINEWIDKTYDPVRACAWALASGYRTKDNGSSWGMFKALAVKYGLKFSQVAKGADAKKFMDENPDSLVVCIMTTGNWTSGGHFILMYKCDGQYVYINDPNSTSAARQKNTFSLLKSQCLQYFCFAKPKKEEDKEVWENKDNVETIAKTPYAVAVSRLALRNNPTTSDGDNIVCYLDDGCLCYATKKCGSWLYVSGDYISADNTATTVSGWCPANCIELASIDNVTSGIAMVCKESIDYLVKIDFIGTPEYWYKNAFKVNYLTNLIIGIANAIDSRKIKENPYKATYTADAAVDYLTSCNVINTPAYWKAHMNDIKYIDTLIIRAAEWLS